MTLLLFLGSVAVLEYLLRDFRRKSGTTAGAAEINNAAAAFDPTLSRETSTADLLSLGQALEAQRAAKQPDSEHVHHEGILR